jgi:Flp pilus assembly protein TadD
LDDFQRAVKLAPDNGEALLYLGAVLIERGDFVRAEDCLTQSIRVQPSNPKAFWLRATARERLNRSEVAESDRATARELDPSFKFAESAMGQNLLRTVTEDKNTLLPIDSLNPRHGR